MIQKILPTGPIDSTMHYEVYRNKNSSEEDFKTIADTYARVMGEDKVSTKLRDTVQCGSKLISVRSYAIVLSVISMLASIQTANYTRSKNILRLKEEA